ncbi:MAG: alpha/beta hydrolase [Oscillospiraceae bacterium]|jgi:fermentation-respiration switch protein FrsA (DUF1100 family)|nr:alpha/beta hydrolase [Oscillospiraceae bacterium]
MQVQTKKSKKKVWAIVVISVLCVLLAGLAFAGNYFYTYALTPPRGGIAPGVASLTDEEEQAAAPSIWTQGAAWLSEHGEDVTIESGDGLALHGYWAANEGHDYAIVVHGYSSRSEAMAAFGEAFYTRGMSVLLPDLRGHGQSEGNYIGMGWPDRLDMLRWIDRIIEQDAEARIALFGISMGAATVMMTAGEALPPQVKLVIEDCGYTSVWDEFTVQMRDQFSLPPFPLLQVASLTTKIRAGYYFSEASSLNQIKKAEVPMLFIHGDQDTFVPFWMMQPLYDAAPVPKEILVVKGAGHGEASAVDPEGYWGAVDAFLAEYFY